MSQLRRGRAPGSGVWELRRVSGGTRTKGEGEGGAYTNVSMDWVVTSLTVRLTCGPLVSFFLGGIVGALLRGECTDTKTGARCDIHTSGMVR